MDGLDLGTLFATLALHDTMSPALQQSSANLLATGQTFQQVGSAMTSAGLALTAGITAPLTALVYASVNAGVEFEGAMNQIQGVLSPTAAQMEAIRQTALQMGADTVFSATDAATAMLELGKAGFTTSEAMASVDEVLTLAAASGLSMGAAAELAARALNSFGLETSDLAHVNDVLAAAVNMTSLEIGDLAVAFGYIGPLAQGVGLSIEMASAAIGIMRDNGVAAETAGRALREAFNSLLNPTAAVTEALASLNVNLYDANGQLLPFDQIIQALEPHAANTGAILEIFGAAAGPGMAALLKEGHGALMELTTQLENSEGAAKSMADAMMQGLPGAIEFLKGSLDTMFISISTELEPTLTTVFGILEKGADFITDTVVPAFAGLPEPVQIVALALAGIAAGLGPLLILFGSVATGIGSITALFGTLGISTGVLTGALGLLGQAVAVVGAFWAGWEIGTWLGNITGLTDAVGHAISRFGEWIGLLPEGTAEQYEASRAAAELNAVMQENYTGTRNADISLSAMNETLTATTPNVVQLTEAQKAYNNAVNSLVKEFSGAGLLEQARQYEDALTRLGGATNLTIDEQIEFATVFQSVIDKYSAMGPKGAAVVAHFAELKDTLISATSALSTEYLFEPYSLSAADAYAATEKMVLGLDELANSGPRTALSTANLFDPYTISAKVAHDASFELLTGLEEFEAKLPTVSSYVHSLALSFLQLGQIIPGVTGSILTFVGQALNGFNTIRSSISTVISSIGQIQTGFGQLGGGSILSGITGIMSGIGGIAGAAGAAIQVVAALGSAIKNAFTSEIEAVVNPTRDLFFAQFLGKYSDPFTALGESMITAAMQAYGVDRHTAWTQYADPLMTQLYQADTYGSLKAAQLAIGELFRQAGVVIDIYNDAGIAQQYQSSVFDQGPGFSYAPIEGSAYSYVPPVPTNITDPGVLASYGTTVTDQLQSSVTGSYAGAPYGGTTFQSGSMPAMGGSGLCVYIQNMYVGSTGQAQSFFQQLYDYIAGGGEGMEKFRDLVCAATPA